MATLTDKSFIPARPFCPRFPLKDESFARSNATLEIILGCYCSEGYTVNGTGEQNSPSSIHRVQSTESDLERTTQGKEPSICSQILTPSYGRRLLATIHLLDRIG